MKISALCVAVSLMISHPLIAEEKPKPADGTVSGQMQIEITSLSLEEYGPMKEDRKFKDGDLIFINLEVRGLKANEKKQVVLQADIAIPQLNLDSKNVINDSTAADEIVPMFFKIPIGEVNRAGFCEVTIKIRDMVAKTASEISTNFQLSNEILTFHCGMLKESKQYDLGMAVKEFPGIKKLLSPKNFRNNREVIIRYIDTFNETVFVIVPKDDSAHYQVIPEESKAEDRPGCGVNFESFKVNFLFNHGGKDFYKVTKK